MNILGVYKNGNYNVTILSDGTKIRKTEEDEFIPEFPENADVKITDKCSQCCPFCFPEDTKIETNDGNKDIKNISIGDIVYSYNENKNKIELKPVEEIYKREYSGELIRIELDNGNIAKIERYTWEINEYSTDKKNKLKLKITGLVPVFLCFYH